MTAWMTSAEAATHAGVTAETIRDWAEAGRLRGVKTTPGSSRSQWRFKLADVDRCLEQGSVRVA